MLRTIHFYGPLKKKFGDSVTLDGANWYQLRCGLEHRFGHKFMRMLEKGKWHLFDGPAEEGYDIKQATIEHTNGSQPFSHSEIHLMPAVKGASGNIGVIIGLILVVVGLVMMYFQIPYGVEVVKMGAMMMATSLVSEMLIKQAKTNAQEAGGDQGSYVYQSAVNVTSQGGPVPLIYGRVNRASSVVITSDFSSDAIV